MTFERLVLATGNRGKYEEFAALLPRFVVGKLLFAPDLAALPVEETGKSYAENALLKARAWAEASGLPALADDSGLEVDALGGAPGLRSARIHPGADEDRNRWLLSQMAGKTGRGARFVAALALALPGGQALSCEGECRGRIAEAPSGTGGFGYDPLFIPDGFSAPFADLPPKVKRSISHRAQAVKALVAILKKRIYINNM